MNIYDLEIRLEELESKLYGVVCLAKDIEREARHFGGEIGRVVGGQLDSYFISWMESFIENKHQPGSIASLRNYLTRKREEGREEDGDR